jgi:hypothetical protein
MSAALHVFSGKVDMGVVGESTEFKCHDGHALHIGDIVQVWYGNWIDSDLEEWTCAAPLSVVVKDSDGPFVMGIKDCGFAHPEWRIRIVKSHRDIVDGEHWPAWGFNYATSTGSDA